MPICAKSPDSSSSSSGSRVWISHLAVLGVTIAASSGVHFFLRRRSGKFRSRVVGIIPARFASSRFEGKPLALILENMGESKLASTLEDVDDEMIAECCRGFGADVNHISRVQEWELQMLFSVLLLHP